MSHENERVVTRDDRGADVVVNQRPQGVGIVIGAAIAVLAVLFVIWLFVLNGAEPGENDTGITVPVENTLPVEPTPPEGS